MQKAADTLQSVADMYDDHARRTQLATHEALNGVSHPYTTYAVRHSRSQPIVSEEEIEASLSLSSILMFPP